MLTDGVAEIDNGSKALHVTLSAQLQICVIMGTYTDYTMTWMITFQTIRTDKRLEQTAGAEARTNDTTRNDLQDGREVYLSLIK